MDPRADEQGDFAALLDAARTGAEWAVAVLYRDLRPRLHRYLRARDSRAADDLEGEVWLAFAQGLPRFEGGEIELRAWLFSIARRRLADHRRTAARRRTEPVAIEELHDLPGGPDPGTAVVELMSARDAAAFIASVLPHDQAEVLLLRVLGDLDVARIAELLDKRPGTVRVLQHRALRRLEAHLAAGAVTPAAPRAIQ